MAQELKEFTLTGKYKILEGFRARLEYRRDWSNVPYFERNGMPASQKNQETIALEFVGFLGPKR